MKKKLPSPKMVQLHKEREEEALKAQNKEESRIENEALKAELLSEIKKEKDKSRKENVTHDVQILILHYLRIGIEFNETKKAKIYASIINRNEDVTRQKFSSIQKFKTEKNLNFLLKYFESIGFEDQIDQIKNDLEKIKQK